MKKFMIALAATTALTVAAPAAAQYGRGNADLGVERLRTELQIGIQSGEISRSEAIPLREQLRQLNQLERRYALDGINGRERADIQRRINHLRQGIRMASRDGRGRYDRNDDRYDRDDDRYDRAEIDPRYDRNRDGWDDRDGNRDGRWDVDSRNDGNRDGWDDRDRDRDGRWDDEDERYEDERFDDRDQIRNDDGRGLIGQAIDSLTGRGGLRVGQQVSANLGAVPYAYRGQFRDGNGSYYRTDGRQIYQIDARNHVIVRIFEMNR